MEPRKAFTDTELLQVLRSDNIPDDAIRYLYREHFRMALSYIRQNSGSEQDAEDIFQEAVLVFIEVIKNNKFRGESSLSTFIHALIRNIWLNELKKRGRSKIRDTIFEKGKDLYEKSASEWMTNREGKLKLMELVGRLGDNCKKILLAFYFDNLPIRDILLKLDYSNEQVVRNKKYKCLKQLEQMLGAEPGLANNLKSVLFYE